MTTVKKQLGVSHFRPYLENQDWMHKEPESDTDIKQIIRDELKKYICGDSSCIFGEPDGQHTNGGCRTLREDSRELKMTLQKLVYFLKDLVK